MKKIGPWQGRKIAPKEEKGTDKDNEETVAD